MGDSTTTSLSTRSRRRVVLLRRRSSVVQNEGSARMCRCGVKTPLWTSWTEKNLGRRFFSCPNYQHGGCGFFEWHDEEIGESAREVINELIEHVDWLCDDNMRHRVFDEKGFSDVQAQIGAINAQMKKVERRIRLTFGALVLTWCFLT